MLLVTFYYSSLKCCLYVEKRYAKVLLRNLPMSEDDDSSSSSSSSHGDSRYNVKSRIAWVELYTIHRVIEWKRVVWNWIACTKTIHLSRCENIRMRCDFIIEFIDCTVQTHARAHTYTYLYIGIIIIIIIYLNIFRPLNSLNVNQIFLFPLNKIGRDVEESGTKWNGLFWWNRKFITHLKIHLKIQSVLRWSICSKAKKVAVVSRCRRFNTRP